MSNDKEKLIDARNLSCASCELRPEEKDVVKQIANIMPNHLPGMHPIVIDRAEYEAQKIRVRLTWNHCETSWTGKLLADLCELIDVHRWHVQVSTFDIWFTLKGRESDEKKWALVDK